MMKVQGISVRYGSKLALKPTDFDLREGQWLMVLGANGAGKSSLIEAVAQIKSHLGHAFCCGKDLQKLKGKDRARLIGTLSQINNRNSDLTVREIVGLGRYAHSRFLSGEDPQGDQKIKEALSFCQLDGMEDRLVSRLSGGETQRVFLARLICQEPRVMLLDEPANHLDLSFQKELFSLIAQWVREPGRAVISAVHDLALARAFGTHALLLQNGEVLMNAPLESVFQSEALNRAYGMDVEHWMQKLYLPWSNQAEA